MGKKIGIEKLFVTFFIFLIIRTSAALPTDAEAEDSTQTERINDEGKKYRLKRTSDGESEGDLVSPLIKFSVVPEPRLAAPLYTSLVLECQAGGTPQPTIHWLKDGRRVEQSREDNAVVEQVVEESGGGGGLGLASTSSRLYLDCVTSEDMGQYSCVAETRYERISAHTKITRSNELAYGSSGCKTIKRANLPRAIPARIYMWTSTSLEMEGVSALFFCRALGSPKPKLQWYDPNDELVRTGGKYELLPTGDLQVHDISWMEHMGTFKCVVENMVGKDEAETFLYPTFE